MGTEICELCRKGKIVKSAELMKFRQWSDKGSIRCSAMVMIGVCDCCNVRSLDASAEKILDEAFQREYNKQPWLEPYPVAFSRAANPQIVRRLDGSGGFLKTLDTKTCKPPKCYLDCERDVVSWILEPLNPKDRETFESFSLVAGKHDNRR